MPARVAHASRGAARVALPPGFLASLLRARRRPYLPFQSGRRLGPNDQDALHAVLPPGITPTDTGLGRA
eukprot:7917339-Alexandrium_andersonii.AAC.1